MIVLGADKQVQVQQGETTMVFKEDKLEITAGGAVKIVHEGASIQIDSSGNIKIKTDKDAEIVAGSCSVKLSGGNVVLKGSKVGLN
ncbi:MAG: hypothetical protein QM765_36855 [Myxococcales bacterium]